MKLKTKLLIGWVIGWVPLTLIYDCLILGIPISWLDASHIAQSSRAFAPFYGFFVFLHLNMFNDLLHIFIPFLIFWIVAILLFFIRSPKVTET
jgi:hypothetical protein